MLRATPIARRRQHDFVAHWRVTFSGARCCTQLHDTHNLNYGISLTVTETDTNHFETTKYLTDPRQLFCEKYDIGEIED